MKYLFKTSFATLVASVFVNTTQAALTLTSPYSNLGPDGDPFLYGEKVSFSNNSFTEWNTSTTVGGWSYINLRAGSNPNRGWGHASSWYLLEIAEATSFQLTLTSSDASARPGFVLYFGESVNDTPASAHTFSNNGNDLVLLNDAWDHNGPDNSPGLSYVAHGYNPVGNSLTGNVYLPPGLYTLAIGNGADSSTSPTAKTYNITMTVPEPSTFVLSMFGGLLAFKRRR